MTNPNIYKTLNKLELIQELKNKYHLTKEDASKVIEIFFGEMTKAFIKGGRVEIRGLCSFSIREYKGYPAEIQRRVKMFRWPRRNHPFLSVARS